MQIAVVNAVRLDEFNWHPGCNSSSLS